MAIGVKVRHYKTQIGFYIHIDIVLVLNNREIILELFCILNMWIHYPLSRRNRISTNFS